MTETDPVKAVPVIMEEAPVPIRIPGIAASGKALAVREPYWVLFVKERGRDRMETAMMETAKTEREKERGRAAATIF